MRAKRRLGRFVTRATESPLLENLTSAVTANGFKHVESSPLTRSSYHAGEDFARLRAARVAGPR